MIVALVVILFIASGAAFADKELPNFPSNPYWQPNSRSYIFTDVPVNDTSKKKYSCKHLREQTKLPIRVVVIYSPPVGGRLRSPNYEYCEI